MRLGEYLKQKREQKGLSLRDLARLSGISHTHISRVESGVYVPSFEKVLALCSSLSVDFSELLRETGFLPSNIEAASAKKMRQVPIISWVTAGKLHDITDAFQLGDADEWTESDVKGQNVFALRVKGDSMQPLFVEGEIIIVNPHVEAKPGDYIIVKNDDNEATFKQLKKYGDTYILHPLNPKYPDIELSVRHKYRIIGKVVEKKMKF